jgi:hypothetical protein
MGGAQAGTQRQGDGATDCVQKAFLIAVFIKVEPAFEKYLFGSGSRSIRAPDEAFRVRTQSTGSILMNTAMRRRVAAEGNHLCLRETS